LGRKTSLEQGVVEIFAVAIVPPGVKNMTRAIAAAVHAAAAIATRLVDNENQVTELPVRLGPGSLL